ncbi:Ankrd11, partial [Symbiodinium sp. CCMP2456]
AQADAEAANGEQLDLVKRIEFSLLKMQRLQEARQVYKYYASFAKNLLFNSTGEGRNLQDLVQKADVNAADRSGQTVLHAAAGRGYSELVALLLEHRAEVNQPARGCSTPLHGAALQGHLKVSRLSHRP